MEKIIKGEYYKSKTSKLIVKAVEEDLKGSKFFKCSIAIDDNGNKGLKGFLTSCVKSSFELANREDLINLLRLIDPR